MNFEECYRMLRFKKDEFNVHFGYEPNSVILGIDVFGALTSFAFSKSITMIDGLYLSDIDFVHKDRVDVFFHDDPTSMEFSDVFMVRRLIKHRLNAIYGLGSMNKEPEIENVKFNGPAVIVFWKDGTKTIVKCQDGDEIDHEKGIAMAISKKTFGNTGSYYDVFKKWLPEK